MIDAIYRFLTRNDPLRPADLICVLAGRMDRKPYGLDLYRAGYAPRVMVSIGRYEISQLPAIGWENVDELKRLRDQTAPDDRHFFWERDASGTRFAQARLPRWSTYGEVLAFRNHWQAAMPRRVILVSTDIHLRRVALVFRHVFRGMAIDACFCAVPAERPEARRILRELLKWIGYRIILAMPAPLIPRLMRLRQ